jgi:hypothetical protein
MESVVWFWDHESLAVKWEVAKGERVGGGFFVGILCIEGWE